MRQRKPEPDWLTPRHIEVLRLADRGRSNQQIADQLGLSRWTVNEYLRIINKRLGTASRSEACYITRQQGLL